MIGDAGGIAHAADVPADVCIVGGGVAGISIALQLAAAGRKVCLLEGGRETFSWRSQELYGGEVWDPRYSLTGTRTRMLGGSSNCWGGWTRPATSNDFDPRPWLGMTGWPVGESDLAPHYARAAELLEVVEPRSDADLMGELPPDLRRLAEIGGEAFRTIFFGMSPPTALGKVHRELLANAPGLDVILEATVTRLVSSPTSDAIEAVEGMSPAGPFRVRAGMVVLAAGGIENPRLLLASGGIGNRHDLVGRYFMDHPRLRMRHLLLDEDPGFARLYDARHYGGGSMVTRRGRHGAAFSPTLAEQARAGVLQSYTGLVATYFGQSDSTMEDARQVWKALKGELHETIDARRLARVIAKAPGAAAYVLGRKLDLRGARMRYEIETVVEPLPDRENRVVLVDAKDRHGVPKIHLTWRRHDVERETHRHALDSVRKAVEARGYGRTTVDPSVWEPERWDSTVITTWHHMGTTRMATAPSQGVVDADCRVFGTSNLYVAGSSVFVTGGGVPPTFTVATLALRLAAHLEGRLSRPALAGAA
ncbi:MAG: GMC family oxidoreductase [Amaricoccus sp.]|uniref:FAD-dependent oxidoreductase n=1 Tax=Amaricoccus sp. TaxID=1872485 RepID=UPI0039E5B7AF